jgi:serine phosphatase RsbU (regulator of sigma subunit)
MERNKNKESRINDINKRLWTNRFGNPRSIASGALKNLSAAEKIDYAEGIAYARLILATVDFLQSKNDSASKYINEALQWFSRNKSEKGYTRAILLKGNIYESLGDYEKTLALWLEAYKISRQNEDSDSEGESCNQLGLIYSRLCDFSKSLEYLKKGLKIREELGDENGVASSLNRMGMVLRQTKKYEESLGKYFRSLEIRKKNKQLAAIPWTLLGIASTYEDMKMYRESLDYYEEGAKGSDKRCTLQCLLGAGRVCNRTGESEKAEIRLVESLKMAKDLKSHVLQAEVYSALASHYELSGQPLRALSNFKRFLKARESYQSNETRSRLSNIEVEHAIEKSEQEKEIFRLRHVELKRAYDVIEDKNRDITASLNYASRIQSAILPEMEEIPGFRQNSFILYIPKAIVSGDFYWFTARNDKIIVVAGDCTGHGVPGALMSMLGISFLEEIVNKRELTDSALILNELRKEVRRTLHQKGTETETKDGMDISLCVIDRRKNIIQYSGAYNNLYLIHDGNLTEYQADRMPIGIFNLSESDFTKQEIPYHVGDLIYMFSDGYADQFGGPANKKIKYAPLKNLLTGIHTYPLKKQKEKLEKYFIKWKGNNDQTDDVLVIGFRV